MIASYYRNFHVLIYIYHRLTQWKMILDMYDIRLKTFYDFLIRDLRKKGMGTRTEGLTITERDGIP